MRIFWIHVWEHSAHLLKEKSSEWLHGTIDIIPSHMHLLTAADLSLPSHHVPLFTPCVHALVLNIHIKNISMEKNFHRGKIFL